MLAFLLVLRDERDKEKVAQLYMKYEKDLCRYARRKMNGKCISGCDAEDILQSAFVKIITYYDYIKLEYGEDRIKGYFYTIVSNEVTNILKNVHEKISIDTIENEIPSDEDLAEVVCLKMEYEEVVKAIQSLDDPYRDPMYLRYVCELSGEKIAKLLDKKVNTVYTCLGRGKAMLLKKLKEMREIKQ